MEKKPEITEFILNFDESDSINAYVIDTQEFGIARLDCPKDKQKEIGQAIVTAVNCTYGDNINPEKILVTIALFQKLYDSIDSCIELTPSLLQECKNALNNIKYK